MQGRKRLWLLIRAAFSLTLLGLLLWKTDLSQFSTVFRNINVPLFLVSLFAYVLLYIPLSYRWKLLLKVLGIEVPIGRLLKTYLTGVFFNSFFPTTVGGDVVRGYDLYRFTQKWKETAVSVIVERFLGFTALIAIAMVSLAFTFSSLRDPVITWVILGAALVYVTTLMVLFSPPIYILFNKIIQKSKFKDFGPKLLQIPEAISLYKSAHIALIQLLFLSVFLQTLVILIYYVLCHSLHLAIPLGYVFLFFPVINLVSMIPISLGGLGVREGISIYLFQKIGVGYAQAFGLSLAWFTIILCVTALGGMVFAARGVNQNPSCTPNG
jgi:glycosyltransferase 2 family protein